MLDAEKPEATVIIRNRKGLHARASAKFVKCAEEFDATIWVMREGRWQFVSTHSTKVNSS